MFKNNPFPHKTSTALLKNKPPRRKGKRERGDRGKTSGQLELPLIDLSPDHPPARTHERNQNENDFAVGVLPLFSPQSPIIEYIVVYLCVCSASACVCVCVSNPQGLGLVPSDAASWVVHLCVCSTNACVVFLHGVNNEHM